MGTGPAPLITPLPSLWGKAPLPPQPQGFPVIHHPGRYFQARSELSPRCNVAPQGWLLPRPFGGEMLSPVQAGLFLGVTPLGVTSGLVSQPVVK